MFIELYLAFQAFESPSAVFAHGSSGQHANLLYFNDWSEWKMGADSTSKKEIN